MKDGSTLGDTCRQQLAVEIEAKVDTERANRRSIADAETCRGPQVTDANVSGSGEHVACIEEADPAEAFPIAAAELPVNHDQAAAALGKATLVECRRDAEPVKNEAAHGSVATREESLAG